MPQICTHFLSVVLLPPVGHIPSRRKLSAHDSEVAIAILASASE
jgi:hypothetical protein